MNRPAARETVDAAPRRRRLRVAWVAALLVSGCASTPGGAPQATTTIAVPTEAERVPIETDDGPRVVAHARAATPARVAAESDPAARVERTLRARRMPFGDVEPLGASAAWPQRLLPDGRDLETAPNPGLIVELDPVVPATFAEVASATDETPPTGGTHSGSSSVDDPIGTANCGTLVCRDPFDWRADCDDFFPMLREDALGVINWNNAALLGIALGGAIGIRQDLDDQVREQVARHPQRWGEATNAFGRFGDVQYQVPVLLALYGWSVHERDDELHAASVSAISALTITGLTTLTVKAIANTDRPSADWNGGKFGFPSYHTASSFALAAVFDEHYGPCVGVPAYLLAGLVGWSRIDEQDHDLSDVVFGAALGFVIGKSVANQHLGGDGRVRLFPYVHPTDGTSGLALDWSF